VQPLPLKQFGTFGGVVLVTMLVVAAAVVRPGADATAARAASFPLPPNGAIVYSRQLGSDALALGVVPQHRRVLVQASVLGRQGLGVQGLKVSFTVRGTTRAATSCGGGCYRARFGVSGRPGSVGVAVRGPAPARWQVALPATWPPRDATALVARAGRVWRSLHSLTFRESLASDAEHSTTSTWRAQAPDRLFYQVENGWAGIIVGAQRWDRAPGSGKWVASPQTPVTQPVPPWVAVADAHVLGSGVVSGRPVWRVSFFDPRSRAWFSATLDRATLRTLETRMITTAHFMHDVYSAFNTTAPVRPPG
jgi:hypothetical protein